MFACQKIRATLQENQGEFRTARDAVDAPPSGPPHRSAGRTTRRGIAVNVHIVKSFDHELDLLDEKLMEMGRLAASMLAQAFDSFTSADRGLGTGLAADPLIGALEGELHELVT